MKPAHCIGVLISLVCMLTEAGTPPNKGLEGARCKNLLPCVQSPDDPSFLSSEAIKSIKRLRDVGRKVLGTLNYRFDLSFSELIQDTGQSTTPLPPEMKTFREDLASEEGWEKVETLLASVGITRVQEAAQASKPPVFGLGLDEQNLRNGLTNILYFASRNQYSLVLANLKSLKGYLEKYDDAPSKIQQALERGYNLVRIDPRTQIGCVIGAPTGATSNIGSRFVALHEPYESRQRQSIAKSSRRYATGIIVNEFPAGVHYFDETSHEIKELNNNKRRIVRAVVQVGDPNKVPALIQDYFEGVSYLQKHQQAVSELKLDPAQEWTPAEIAKAFDEKRWQDVEAVKARLGQAKITRKVSRLYHEHWIWAQLAKLWSLRQ